MPAFTPDIEKIQSVLRELYPDAVCSLEYAGDPWRLLIAARLSAQCTDERVNIVCVPLFEAYPDVCAMADAEIPAVEEIQEPYEDVIIEEAGEIVSNFVPDDPDAE